MTEWSYGFDVRRPRHYMKHPIAKFGAEPPKPLLLLTKYKAHGLNLITGDYSWESSPRNMLNQFHIPNVLQRRDYFSGIYVYKSLNYQFPSYMSHLLHHVSEYNMHSTRNNVESKLYIPKPNIEIYRQSFQYAAPKFYNSLPTDITACTSLDQFKSKLRSYVMKNPVTVLCQHCNFVS